MRQKTAPFYFLNNYVKALSKLIIFGKQIPESVSHHLHISYFVDSSTQYTDGSVRDDDIRDGDQPSLSPVETRTILMWFIQHVREVILSRLPKKRSVKL